MCESNKEDAGRNEDGERKEIKSNKSSNGNEQSNPKQQGKDIESDKADNLDQAIMSKIKKRENTERLRICVDAVRRVLVVLIICATIMHVSLCDNSFLNRMVQSGADDEKTSQNQQTQTRKVAQKSGYFVGCAVVSCFERE